MNEKERNLIADEINKLARYFRTIDEVQKEDLEEFYKLSEKVRNGEFK